MSETDADTSSEPRAASRRTDDEPPASTRARVLRDVRWVALAVYAGALAYTISTRGAPLDREGVILWITLGLAASCIGRRPVRLAWLVLDFLPFALVLVFYDYLRGLADGVGMPTWWQPQLDADKLLFFGHVPTVWLQEHLKHQRYSGVRWYDVIVSLCYYSFFFLPYVTAGVMWLRSRTEFYRWSLRFVALSFFCFLLFMLIPTAPPWAAGHCTAADVAGHPDYAPCMYATGVPPPDALLGRFTTTHIGANPWVERIAGDGLGPLHLGIAHQLWTKGFSTADPVAAVPSLHVGGTVLFCLFVWRRAPSWRPLLVMYPLLMVFSLAYAGEHYVSDGIAGALAALLVHTTANRLERWRKQRRAATASTAPVVTPAVTQGAG